MTKIIQFRIEDFNPDCMSADEIRQWIAAIGPGHRPAIAKQWFAGQRGMFEHARNVRNYLWNKLTAMELRLEGSIAKALAYEVICDRIYKELPDVARW